MAEPEEKSRREEEFKTLQEAKEILANPMMAMYYQEWMIQNQAAAATRGRAADRPRPTQARWPPTRQEEPSSSSRTRPTTSSNQHQHFEEAKARFSGRPAEKVPPPRQPPSGSRWGGRQAAVMTLRMRRRPLQSSALLQGAGAPPAQRPKKAPPPPQSEIDRRRMAAQAQEGESTAPKAGASTSEEAYRRPAPARPTAPPSTKRPSRGRRSQK